MSALMNDHHRFVMEHIQNATLAGGVAIGAVADLMVGPWAALMIGTIAGTISVVGFDIISVNEMIPFNYQTLNEILKIINSKNDLCNTFLFSPKYLNISTFMILVEFIISMECQV